MIEKLKINSIHDGLPLDILIATCNNPKAIVQIVHGMCEYKERYLDFINFLNKQLTYLIKYVNCLFKKLIKSKYRSLYSHIP